MNSSLNIDLHDQRQTASPWLIDLDQISAEQQPQVGNLVGNLVGTKALHLARMQQAGFAVPGGFCITTAAFRQGYGSNPQQNPQQQATLNSALRAAILAAFSQLQQRYPNSRFAVRSSALEEDGQHASWAGMFHSSLGIDSSATLLAAVEQGFASLQSDAVRLYRQQQRLAGNPPAGAGSVPAMALIIQRQVEPTAAGMVFTRNPLARPGHPDHDRLCINAVRGLAEALADGETDGDHYWLDRDNRLLEHRLAPAQPGQSVQPPVLSRAQMRQLARAARQLEQLFGYPLDIEFALQNQQLWLLQARAIVSAKTGLSRPAQHWLQHEQRRLAQRLEQLQRQQQLRCGPGILSNSNIAELLPSPTPMSFAIFNQIFAGPDGAIPNGRRALGYRTATDSTAQMFELVAGQPYFHLEIDARSYEQGYEQAYKQADKQSREQRQPLPIADYLAQVRDDPQRANYPEFGLYQQFISAPDAQAHFGDTAGAQRYRDNRRFHRHMTLHGQRYLHQYHSWVDRYLDQYRQQQRAIELASLNAPQLIIQINQWLRHLRQVSCCHFVMAARLGFYFAESLRFELQQRFGDQAEHWMTRLLQALPGSRINQQSFDLQAVAEQRLSRQDYLARYGHLSSNELELSLPRYDERPELIESLLNNVAQTAAENRAPMSGQQQPQQAFVQQQRQRKQQERQLSRQLDKLGLSPPQRQQLWSDLRLARRFLPLRETIKYHYAGEYALIRQALLQLGQRLRLADEQIFYLQPDELPLCLKELPTMRRLIEQRHQQRQLALEIARQQPLPPVIFGDRIELNESTVNPQSNADDDGHNHDDNGGSHPRSNQHTGRPMAPGFIRGKVRLIDPQHCDLHQLMATIDKDDIIVTRSANLGLSPLMRKVAGLIVEVGGLLAHSACQAREAGIPAMVLPDATRLLTEGSQIAFDGQTGQLYGA